jgi:hypothetical protein
MMTRTLMPPLPTDDLPSGDLGAAIVALGDRVAALNRHMEYMVDEKVQTKVETEIAAKSIPREEYLRRVRRSGRRVAAGMILLLALLALAVGLNRLTLQQAQHDLNDQIVNCFLRPGSNTPAQAQACARRFGNGYAENQRRSREATADFADLRTWAKERGWQPPSER